MRRSLYTYSSTTLQRFHCHANHRTHARARSILYFFETFRLIFLCVSSDFIQQVSVHYTATLPFSTATPSLSICFSHSLNLLLSLSQLPLSLPQLPLSSSQLPLSLSSNCHSHSLNCLSLSSNCHSHSLNCHFHSLNRHSLSPNCLSLSSSATLTLSTASLSHPTVTFTPDSRSHVLSSILKSADLLCRVLAPA